MGWDQVAPLPLPILSKVHLNSNLDIIIISMSVYKSLNYIEFDRWSYFMDWAFD